MSAALSFRQTHWCKDGHVVPLPLFLFFLFFIFFPLRDASPPLRRVHPIPCLHPKCMPDTVTSGLAVVA
ncbi:hypothetical protein BDQ94DRAFT_70329 [Aspergillus welwitschiae]|uniref:Uncharacterized protein n=1 Tax=Aspergillus welwitschiae TaxID=1341132 RepID=A0A3F3QFI8_9EURO|nr:hypothetical protein BDQ94DRAFT_70329 [Aspergillus welwitschiae]RDH37820.1 hypothetical protein BDQ94DRAFT_70329 [Aspergillus welwitschiae]